MKAGTLCCALALLGGLLAGGPSHSGLAINGLAPNGTQMNGMAPNGLAPNGLQINGLAPNGQTPNGQTLNGQSLNGLAVNGVTQNGLTINGIQMNGLALRGLRDAASAPMLLAAIQNADGRETLRVLTTCALPDQEELKVAMPAGTLAFQGAFGLAPEWSKGPLSETGQRWVSACVLALTNAKGVHVRVSLRGVPSGLAPTLKEVEEYTAEEGAFYGNLFSETPYAVSCIGDSGANSPDSENRVCATEVRGAATACGFVSAGQCRTVCDVRGSEYGPTYTNCRSRADDDLGVSEVITVFLSGRATEH